MLFRSFNAEMENVVLSLDGRKQVHNAIRKTVNGKGSYDFVINNIKNFVKSRGDKHYYVRGTFTAKNLDFSKDVLFLADNGFDSISMEPVVTDIDDLAIKEEHIPEILEEYERLCDEYLEGMRGAKASISFISTLIWRADLVCPSAFPRAARATNIFPLRPTAIFTPATSLWATKNLRWAT